MAADKQSDQQQIVQASFDVTAQAIKTVSQSTSEIAISHVDDSIQAYNPIFTTSAAVTSAATTVAIAEIACQGVGSVMLYVKTTTTIVGPQLLTIEVSPATTGDVWFTTSTTTTPSTTAGVVVATAILPIAAMRVRVKQAAAITSGTYAAYLVGGS